MMFKHVVAFAVDGEVKALPNVRKLEIRMPDFADVIITVDAENGAIVVKGVQDELADKPPMIYSGPDALDINAVNVYVDKATQVRPIPEGRSM